MKKNRKIRLSVLKHKVIRSPKNSSHGKLLANTIYPKEPRRVSGSSKMKKRGCRVRSWVRRDANDPGTKQCAHFMPEHYTPGTKNDEVYSPVRMRGGGCTDLTDGILDGDFTWRNAKFTMPARLEPGGESYPTIACGKNAGKQKNDTCHLNEDSLQWNTVTPDYLSRNKCKLRNDEISDNARCACPNKSNLDAGMKKKGLGMCIRKPCLGTDCLIKAFKDAQEFVDSIGKGPGLGGLGIIDSPYFPSPQEKTKDRKNDSKSIGASKQLEGFNQPFNPQNLEHIKGMHYNAGGNSLTVPNKSTVQEGITIFPDPSNAASIRSKKKDDKADKPKESESLVSANYNFEETPCGQPKCKSRPKKSVELKNSESAEKINASPEKVSSNAPQKSDKKYSKSRNGEKSISRISKPGKSSQFIYSFGNAYPTSVYGHKKCSLPYPRVPPNMGWMWNQIDVVGNRKPRPGWKPGAISVFLRDLLHNAKQGFLNYSTRPMTAPSKGKKGKLPGAMSFPSMKKQPIVKEEVDEQVEYPPTLHIHRKDGDYYLTMYPIRQETSDSPKVDEPLNPLQFKIVKSKGSISSSTTASDMEIEFSPPAAVNRIKKKPNVIHVETQVKHQEILDAFKNPDPKKKEKDGKAKKDNPKKK